MCSIRPGADSTEIPNSALYEFTNNYQYRQSAEWVPIESAGIASSSPKGGQLIVYHRNNGLVPNYGGHVPGEAFTFGRTYGSATRNAKYWLAKHKD